MGLMRCLSNVRKELLNAEINRIEREPKFKARLLAQGLELPESTPEQFDAHIRREITKWAKVLKANP